MTSWGWKQEIRHNWRQFNLVWKPREVLKGFLYQSIMYVLLGWLFYNKQVTDTPNILFILITTAFSYGVTARLLKENKSNATKKREHIGQMYSTAILVVVYLTMSRGMGFEHFLINTIFIVYALQILLSEIENMLMRKGT